MNKIFNNKNIRIININNINYIVARDFANLLGYVDCSKTNKWCKHIVKYNLYDGRQKREVNIISEEDILSILIKSKTKNQEFKEEVLEWLKINNIVTNNKIVLTSRKEIEFLDMLIKILEPFEYECIKQYKVLNYRIDLYIPKLKLVIEYDENDHKDYTYEEQEGRQKEIEKELDCKFIRVSDKDSDLWNCGYIMKSILHNEILGGESNERAN